MKFPASKVGLAFSLLAGLLTLLNGYSLAQVGWHFYSLPISLLTSCGTLIFASCFMACLRESDKGFWGSTVMFLSAVGFVALGVAKAGGHLIPPGLLALTLGVLGGVLIAASKRR